MDAKYILIKLGDEKTDELKTISITALPVIAIIKTGTFWMKLANLVKLIEYPVKIIGKLNQSLIWNLF